LQPGASQTITFNINAADLASFDTNSTSWIAEAGKYSIKIGASSTSIKQTAIFGLANDNVVEKDNKVLAPQVDIKEFKPANNNATGYIQELNGFVTMGQ